MRILQSSPGALTPLEASRTGSSHPSVGRDGRREAHGSRDEWLAAWKAKVEAVEAAPNSVAGRRAVLERMLAANADAFRAIQRHGTGVAVIEATGLAAAADGRLASAGAPLAAAAE